MSSQPASVSEAAKSSAASARIPDGVWRAKRIFGPDVRGTLEISRARGSWRAQIAAYTLALNDDRGRLSFDLPGEQGSFIGRLDGGAIRGHWLQPPTVNDGSKLASPVTLKPAGPDRWRGEVVPASDELTLYLVVHRGADGVTTAYLRNPDRNIGIFWNLERVEQIGDRVQLIGRFLGRGAPQVFGEGVYRAGDKLLSIYFPQRGGTFDFTPLAEGDAPGFLARGAHPEPWRYQPPIADDDGWPVGTLSEVGMAAEPIADLVRVIDQPEASLHDTVIHGVLVARHGKLVLEEYFHGFDRARVHDTRSAAKSITATMVGAAIQRGAKLATSTRVYDLLYRGAPPGNLDARKLDMTVEHLLTMASGFNCDDWDGTRPGSENTVTDDRPDPDYYRYTLQLPMEMKPGEQAVYCSINPNLLGAVLSAATGRTLLELFDELIADPLQIRRYYLPLQPTGEPYLGGGQKYLPRDFMKLGQMMLNGGTWRGKRVLPRNFVERASSPLVTLRAEKFDMHYGYLWWTTEYRIKDRTLRAYFATGNGGQVVVVIPDLDLVIAGYGGNYSDKGGWTMVREYIPGYILPALRDSTR